MSFLFTFVIKPLAYISLPVFTIQRIASQPVPSPLRYYARLVFYVGTLLTVASCGFVVAVGMTLLGRPYGTNYLIANTFYTIVHRALDLKVEIEGEEYLEAKPAVLMSNHQSMIDVLILGRLLSDKVVVMAKTSLKYTPLGPFMTLAGNIFIDRGNSTRAVRSVEAAGERMKKDGLSLWIYPEGTRHISKSPDMLPFKKGGFHLAINAGIPIIPIIIENYWHIYHKDVFDTGVIKVKILPPIPTTSMTTADVPGFAADVRRVMLEALYEISPKISSEKASKSGPVVQVVTEKVSTDKATKQPEASNNPLESITESLVSPSIGVLSSSGVEAALSSVGSTSSLASSSVSVQRSVREDGAETEEDDEMVLVGRPKNN